MDIGLSIIQQRAWALANRFREQLRHVPGATLHDIGREQCAIVSFSVEGADPRAAVAQLREQGINIGASDPTSTRIDSETRNLPTMLRAAPHYYNTDEEVDRALDALTKL